MEHRRSARLDQAIATIQQQWGYRALYRGDGDSRQPGLGLPTLSTGFADLDRLLGLGGIPQGRITEFIGSGSAGQVTLAGRVLAGAQRDGQQVAYVDVERQVDLDVLARCGVSFEALAILRPLSFRHAVEMTRDLLVEGGAGAIVFDRLHDYQAGPPHAEGDFDLLDRALREWNLLVSRSLCALVFITEVTSLATYPPDLSLPYFAALRLGLEWEDWLAPSPAPPRRGEQQIVGFSSRVTVLKNKLGPAGGTVALDMTVFER